MRHEGRVEVLERAVHDLKNPLAVVRASLEWLEVELAGRDDALDAVADATAAANRLGTIIDDLDMLARLGKEGASAAELVALTALVQSVVKDARERLARRGMSAVAITSGALTTRGDRGLLARSLAALIDATARGAPSGSCVEVTLAASSEGLPLEIGIALEGSVASDENDGSLDALESAGLGVYVAQRAVEVHGGTLQVIATSSLPRIVVRLPT